MTMVEKSRKGMIGIYQLSNVHTKECFIGASASMNSKMKTVTNLLLAGKHLNEQLQQAWNRDGCEAFEFSILEIVASVYLLHERELYWLKKKRAFEIDLKTDHELKNERIPSSHISVNNQTKQDIRDLKLGTLIHTIKLLIEFYQKNSLH